MLVHKPKILKYNKNILTIISYINLIDNTPSVDPYYVYQKHWYKTP